MSKELLSVICYRGFAVNFVTGSGVIPNKSRHIGIYTVNKKYDYVRIRFGSSNHGTGLQNCQVELR